MVLNERTYHQRGEAMIAQGVLGFQYEEEQRAAGMTAIRFWLIRHARGLLIRLSAGHPSLALLLDARRTIHALAQGPPVAV